MIAPYPAAAIAKVLSDKNKKLVFIIGNGFQPVDSIQKEEDFKDSVRTHYGADYGAVTASWTDEDWDLERWKYLEYARFFTRNCTPSFGYYLLNYLIGKQHIKTIITTNYDLFLNSMFERTNKDQDSYCFNPAIRNTDFDWEGYYSKTTPSNHNAVKIFKIHGSLSHVVFRNCLRHNNQLHIFRLPSFMLGFDTRPIRDEFSVKYLHDYLGHIGRRYRHTTLIDDASETGYYVHHIDWAVKCLCAGIGYRDFFSKEIEFAKSLGLKYYYLGYYIENNKSMSYKNRFFPNEKYIWESGFWKKDKGI